MLGLGDFRKHGDLLLAGAAAITTGLLFYQEYQRRTSGATKQITDDTEGELIEEQDDNEDDDDDIDDRTRNFEDVMDNLSISRLAQVALKLRIDVTQNKTSESMSRAELLGLTCIVYAPLCGSFNLAHRIVFNDGVEWYARVPGHGMHFGELEAQKMDSEYHTMRYIQAHTKLPLPEVIFWSSSTSLIGVPFGIISAVKGEPLCAEWDDMTEDKRCIALQDAARYISQLHSFQFSQIGALRFSEEGSYSHVGARIELEGVGTMDLLNPGQHFFRSTKAVANGPYLSLLSALIARIEAADKDTDHIRRRSHIPILCALIETMPPELLTEGRFCLHLPDFDWQNIYVGPDGHVTGLIDWDCVYADASIRGYAKVPLFLCADWNPAYYNYEPDAIDTCGHCADMSPEDHRKYRACYSQAFAAQLENLPEYDPRMSSLSHIVTAIDLATDDDFARQYIVAKLLKEADVPFRLSDYCNDFEAGDASVKDSILREAFFIAWKNGWDTAEVGKEEDLALSAELELAYKEELGSLKEESSGSSCFELLEAEEESSDE